MTVRCRDEVLVIRHLYDLARTVSKRYARANGRNTAAAITLYGFLAMFALVVLAVAVVGFVSATDRDVAQAIVDWLGVTGAAAQLITDAVETAQNSKEAATVVGVLGLVWVGSSFALAVASAYDTVWQVPTRGARSRLVGLGWLLGAFVLLAAGGYATSLVGRLQWLVALLVVMVSLAVNTGLWLWTSWVLPNRRIPWRASLPAALLGAVGLEILKLLGGYVVPRLVAGSSALYGAIGVVFALIAWLWLFGRLAVLVTIVEVLGWERGHGTVEVVVRRPAISGGDTDSRAQ